MSSTIFVPYVTPIQASWLNDVNDTVYNALQLADYTALRSYVGPRKSVYVSGYLVTAAPSGTAGMFLPDPSDMTSTDNNATIILSINGIRWKRQFEQVVNPSWFGAKGDGTDETAKIQAVLNYAAPLKMWIRGGTNVYKVSTVNMLSGQRIQTMYLESIGPLTAGAVSFQPVAQINGLTALKTDMHFIDVKVNGRRDLFPNIDMSLGEDGGMHAWRVVGDAAGGVTNILWENCDGVNAGTAGLAVHSVNPASGAGGATYPLKNLRWFGGNLTGNREHGWFADAFDGLTIVDADCRYNGQDLNLTDPLVSGNRGARSGGTLFGAAFDAESYGPLLVGSLWKNMSLRNLDCRNCAMPAVMYNPIATNVAGYMPHTGIIIAECKFDKGTATGADRQALSDYSFNALGNLTGTSYPYLGLVMVGNTFDGAAPQFNGVKGLSVTGGYINSTTVKVHIYNCLNWDVSSSSASSGLDISPLPLPVYTKVQGSTGAFFAAQTLVRTFSIAGGGFKYHLEGRIEGGASVDGDLIYTTVSPISGMFIGELDSSARSPTGKAIPTTDSVDIGGTVTFVFSTSSNAAIFYKIMITLYPSA